MLWLICTVCRQLKDIVGNLRTTGCTALGPALAVATAMATCSTGGSAEVILCTDGMPNTGIGALDYSASAGQSFYEKVSYTYCIYSRRCLSDGYALNITVMEIKHCDWS